MGSFNDPISAVEVIEPADTKDKGPARRLAGAAARFFCRLKKICFYAVADHTDSPRVNVKPFDHLPSEKFRNCENQVGLSGQAHIGGAAAKTPG